MGLVESWLGEMRDIRSTGAGDPETSYYPPLEGLVNEIGKGLKPKVRCVISLRNAGAGKPDGGFFTREQFQRPSDSEPKQGQLPARGAVEVKPPSEDVGDTARSKQVTDYLGRYGLVLVTNYREFLLLGQDAQGNPLPMEGFTLVGTEKEFWQAATHPEKTAKEHGERLCEYLKRVMLTNAPLTTPEDLAWFLASYARDARVRVEQHKDLSPLTAVRSALEEALGTKFTGEKGEHFFRSTLVQTIFYGVFSAWALWHRERPDRTDAFDWKMAEWSLRVPFIRALYEEVATPSKLGPLGLVEVLDWTAAALNRVDRAAFFQKFQDQHAVQYFYAPFLEAFDPELRKELGVWYTPPEIVQYHVARVDAVLREELKLEDGLADPNVIVLDPCCGTGAYLVEVLRRIADTLRAKGGDALTASDLKRAAMTRVFGFEILPAPFVVSHLQLGLMLHRLGAPLSGSERVGVYLTNSLTGWEPPKGPKQHILPMPELEQERDAADGVKREAKILVILGNPPYNAFAGVSPAEEQGLVELYKEGLSRPVAQGGWGIKKFNLDDLYIRFFRLAERRIAEMTGKGIVAFISNHSWIAEPSFVVLRKHLLDNFDRFWIENLHGNRKISEYAPDGRTSETIFAIRGFSVGIQQGVATSLWVKTGSPRKAGESAKVHFRDDINAAKAEERRRQLVATLTTKNLDAAYTPAKPCKENRYSFRPENVSAEYNVWPALVDLAGMPPFAGISEDRKKALFGVDRSILETRMKAYFDRSVSWDELSRLGTCLTQDVPRFDARMAREKLQRTEGYSESRLVRFALRPFDVQWCYYSPVRPLWREPRPDYWAHYEVGTPCIVARFKSAKSPEGPPLAFARQLCDYHMMPPNSSVIPFYLRPADTGSRHAQLFADNDAGKPALGPNLSPPALAYLAGLGVKDPDPSADVAGLVWMHALAVGYSPAYLSENADGIRRDWPRVPLPNGLKALESSAALGRQIAALLDTQADVPGVTGGNVELIFRTIAVLTKVSGGELDPSAGDLAVTVGWGHAGKGGVTMPAKGRIVHRPYEKAELDAIADAAKARGFSQKQALALLGPDTRDVYLNDKAYWKNVPAKVWEYYIGGYQVIKKWLSYREQELLGRPLTREEAREVTNMARRLAAIILLQTALDENYGAVKRASYAWPSG